MDGLSEGEMLSSNFWGRLSDTAVPSVVDDDKGFESNVRRAQMRIADTSGLLPPGSVPAWPGHSAVAPTLHVVVK